MKTSGDQKGLPLFITSAIVAMLTSVMPRHHKVYCMIRYYKDESKSFLAKTSMMTAALFQVVFIMQILDNQVIEFRYPMPREFGSVISFDGRM